MMGGVWGDVDAFDRTMRRQQACKDTKKKVQYKAGDVEFVIENINRLVRREVEVRVLSMCLYYWPSNQAKVEFLRPIGT